MFKNYFIKKIILNSITKIMSWQFKDKKVESVRKVIQEMGLVLLEHTSSFNLNPMPRNNYCLDDGIGKGFNVKIPYKKSKKYGEITNQLNIIKSYITHFNNLPSDNFFNRFKDYDATGNETAVETTKKFLNEKSLHKGLWLHGKSGIGKSHLLVSIIYSYLQKQIEKKFSKLELNQYFNATTYGGNNSRGVYSNLEEPNLFYFSYMHDILCETHHKHSQSSYKRKFGDDDKTIIYFLDDVCEKDKQEILNHLINMYNTNLGNTAITSNYSMSDWLKIATSGQNQMGLEGRLRTFFKEIEIVGNTKRKPTW